MQRAARVIVVEIENTVPLVLDDGSVPMMDDFMSENATDVSLQNLERIEDKPDEPGIKLCYLEPTDFGPFRSQMRLTVKVEPASGSCDVNILNMETGTVDKKTGDVKWPDPKADAGAFKFDTKNIISWEPRDDKVGLKLQNVCQARSETVLPGWFPLPDAVMQSIVRAFVRKVISDGQEKVMEQMQTRFTKWMVEKTS